MNVLIDDLKKEIINYNKKIEEIERQIALLESQEADYKIEVGDVFLHIDSTHDCFHIIRIKMDSYRDITRNNSIVYGVEIISSNTEYGSPTIRNTAMYRDDIRSIYKRIDPEHYNNVLRLFNEYKSERTDLNVKYHKQMTEIIKEDLQ